MLRTAPQSSEKQVLHTLNEADCRTAPATPGLLNTFIQMTKGGGGLANSEITEKILKIAINMDFYPTRHDILKNFVN